MLKKSSPHGKNYFLNNNKRMGKFISILIMLILFIVSCVCQMNCEEIRKEVRRRPVHPILYNLVRMYCQAYYVLPDEYDDLFKFMSSYKENEPAYFSELEYFTGVNILETFAPHKVRYAFYKDSVFFLLNTHAGIASCYFIGDQFYRLSHPESFLLDEMDFWSSFESSAFNREGDYLFPSQFNYSELDSCINMVHQKYNALVLAKGYYIIPGEYALDRILANGYSPLLCIIYYSGIDDSINIISDIPPIESLLLKTTTSDLQVDTICMKTSVQVFCQEYLSEIKDAIFQRINDYSDIGAFMTTIPLYGNL